MYNINYIHNLILLFIIYVCVYIIQLVFGVNGNNDFKWLCSSFTYIYLPLPSNFWILKYTLSVVVKKLKKQWECFVPPFKILWHISWLIHPIAKAIVLLDNMQVIIIIFLCLIVLLKSGYLTLFFKGLFL